MTLTDADIDRLTAEYLGLDISRKEIESHQNAIKAELRAELGTGEHVSGKHRIVITPNRRYSPALATELLETSVLDYLCRCAIEHIEESHLVEPRVAREVLNMKEYASCQVEIGDARVTIGSAD